MKDLQKTCLKTIRLLDSFQTRGILILNISELFVRKLSKTYAVNLLLIAC